MCFPPPRELRFQPFPLCLFYSIFSNHKSNRNLLEMERKQSQDSKGVLYQSPAVPIRLCKKQPGNSVAWNNKLVFNSWALSWTVWIPGWFPRVCPRLADWLCWSCLGLPAYLEPQLRAIIPAASPDLGSRPRAVLREREQSVQGLLMPRLGYGSTLLLLLFIDTN